MRILLVCLGNICRSPMAEGILRAKVRGRGLSGWEIDSAGTAGYHAGEPADPRTLSVLRRQGALCDLVARQVQPGDFERFDVVLAMDRSNLEALRRLCPPHRHDRLALALHPVGGADVPDPYYGGNDGFDHVYRLLDDALERWLDAWTAAPQGT